MSTLPNDIGLAKHDDVGDVANLNTQSKIIVNAINEVLANAGSSTDDQAYVNGDGNKISGVGNVIYGDSNIVIGNNNLIIGDNLIVLGDKKQINSKPNFYLYNADPYSKTVYYDDYTYPDDIVVGDTITLGIDISCMRYDDEGNYDWVTLSIPPFITTVASNHNKLCRYSKNPYRQHIHG